MKIDIEKYKESVGLMSKSCSDLIFSCDEVNRLTIVDAKIIETSKVVNIFSFNRPRILSEKHGYYDLFYKFFRNGGKLNIIVYSDFQFIDKEFENLHNIFALYFQIRKLNESVHGLIDVNKDKTFFVIGDDDKFRIEVNNNQSLVCFNSKDHVKQYKEYFDTLILNSNGIFL